MREMSPVIRPEGALLGLLSPLGESNPVFLGCGWHQPFMNDAQGSCVIGNTPLPRMPLPLCRGLSTGRSGGSPSESNLSCPSSKQPETGEAANSLSVVSRMGKDKWRGAICAGAQKQPGAKLFGGWGGCHRESLQEAMLSMRLTSLGPWSGPSWGFSEVVFWVLAELKQRRADPPKSRGTEEQVGLRTGSYHGTVAAITVGVW